MDEKWDVFVESHVALLRRGWTGRGIFEATFSPVDGGWTISAAVAGSKFVRNASSELNSVDAERLPSAALPFTRSRSGEGACTRTSTSA